MKKYNLPKYKDAIKSLDGFPDVFLESVNADGSKTFVAKNEIGIVTHILSGITKRWRKANYDI